MRRIIIVLAFALVATACAKPASPDSNEVSKLVQKAVEATLAAQPTQVAAPTATIPPPTVALTATREQPATATTVPTAVPTNTSTPAPTATTAPTDIPTRVPSATPTMAPSVIVDKVVNLRAGPGTNYALVGTTKVGDQYNISGRNQDGSWLEVCCINNKPAWVAKSVVTVGGDIAGITVAKNIPPTPVPAPTAKPAPAAKAAPPPQKDFGASFPQIGQEVQGNGWNFKVSAVHKRKAVYFYDSAYVAFGHWLIVIIDATNAQSGSDYFARNIGPWISDQPGKTYEDNSKASGYAEWQYGGLTSIYSDVNPGNLARIALAFDIPDNEGDVLLSTKIPLWVYLGNFAAMSSED
jgi:uncharacterized protein YraI